VRGSCEHSNESLGFIKGKEFIENSEYIIIITEFLDTVHFLVF
jgi:hypothetical protein